MAKLTARGRARVAKKNFAIKKGGGSYPIHDIAHARNALARVSQHGSTSDKVTVRAAVYKAFPSLKPDKKK